MKEAKAWSPRHPLHEEVAGDAAAPSAATPGLRGAREASGGAPALSGSGRCSGLSGELWAE